jgi:SAM-dependent methyltransferase
MGPGRTSPTGPLIALLRRAQRAVRTYGLVGTLRKSWAAARTAPRTRRALKAEQSFDRQFHVDTAGIVRLERLAIGGANRSLGVRYQGSDPAAVRATLRDLQIDYPKFVFIDLGSGKGRVILVASEFPFKRIVGVEFSPELHETAVRNIASYSNPARRSAVIESVCIDAAEYELPDEPLVLYFYNPFLEPLMRTVLRRIAASLQASPRDAYLVFTGDVAMAPLIEEVGFVRLPASDLSGADGLFVWPTSKAAPPSRG